MIRKMELKDIEEIKEIDQLCFKVNFLIVPYVAIKVRATSVL